MRLACWLLGWVLLQPARYLAAADLAETTGTRGPYDILIVNGRVLDGSGSEPGEANIGIEGDTIDRKSVV